jgi:hypothetical protein
MKEDKVYELDEKEWPDIRKAKAAAKTAWSYFEGLTKEIQKQLGDKKTCEILGGLMTENARKYIKAGMKGFGIEGNDPWAIANFFKLTTGSIIGYKAEVIRYSDKMVGYRLYPPCLWFPKLDIPPSFCQALGCFEHEALKIMNPKLTYRQVKLMTAGDDYCEGLFEEMDEDVKA